MLSVSFPAPGRAVFFTGRWPGACRQRKDCRMERGVGGRDRRPVPFAIDCFLYYRWDDLGI